jgi:hypothetical protein
MSPIREKLPSRCGHIRLVELDSAKLRLRPIIRWAWALKEPSPPRLPGLGWTAQHINRSPCRLGRILYESAIHAGARPSTFLIALITPLTA